MKTVCIVGAGPAGLVAAKTFLQTGRFEVTVYEKCSRIGGIWALDKTTQDGFLNPQTPTNLSRFTVSFSDHDWNSVDLDSERSDSIANGDQRTHQPSPPMFPKAWHVNRYLETYKKKYLPNGVVRCGCEVVKAQWAEKSFPFWRVTTRDSSGRVDTQHFHYLIIASGFFSKPRPLSQNVPNLPPKSSSEAPVRTVHSSQFRTLKDLFPDEERMKGKSILLIGGGNSSGETAAAVAMQLSDSQWSPSAEKRHPYEGCRVLHVTSHHLYALPPFVERGMGSRAYMPIDFVLYDLSKRPPGKIEAGAGQQSPQLRKMVHSKIQEFVGGDQSDLGASALVTREEETVYVALSESYSEFVRSGLIDVIGGRVSSIRHQGGSGTASATVKTQEGDINIETIGAIIYATGYTPWPALGFLEEHIKEKLHYDGDSARLPLLLNQWQTASDAVSNLALLGFYEGPYWPMMEMQARLTAERWLNGNTAPVRPFETSEKLVQLRQAMKQKAIDVPQYWFGDYLGYMEEIANFLSLQRNDGAFQAERYGCTSPARYTSDVPDKSEADNIMTDLQRTWKACLEDGLYVPRATFRALQGDWLIERRIVSADQNFSGSLSGRASFHPRFPTDAFDLEYLYIEFGTFTSASGLQMQATRRYVYRYSETRDELSVWFVRPDNDLQVDYLFHNLAFVKPTEAREAGAIIAKAEHLCVDDMYTTQYRLPLKGIALLEFEVRHAVSGPHKDYVATTQYTRPVPQGEKSI